MVIGTKFNIILYSDILNKIAEATNSLCYDIYCEPVEIAEEIVNDKMKEMKDLINCYIDQQLTTYIQYKKEYAKKYTKSGKTNFYCHKPENLSDEQA